MQVLTEINESTKEWKRLDKIFEENVFELFEGPNSGEMYCIYMMTDAIESIVVFEDAVITGKFEADNKNLVTASITVLDDGYMLAVRQGNDNAFTVRFRSLRCVENLYQYADIGHFWMKENEILRGINYQIGLMFEKYAFMGKDYCTAKEKALLPLYEFAPLRRFVCVYWEEDEKFVSTVPGVEAMLAFAQEAKDEKMTKLLGKYRTLIQKDVKDSTISSIRRACIEKRLSAMLTKVTDKTVIDLICSKIKTASKEYEIPSFGKEKDKLVYKCRTILQKHFPNRQILEERSFCIGESFKYAFHVVDYETKRGRMVLQKMSYVIEGDDCDKMLQNFWTQIR